MFDTIFNNYFEDKDIIQKLLSRRKDRYHHYHSEERLNDIIKHIEKNSYFNDLNLYEKHALLIASFFHNVIYDPRRIDNEKQSIALFKRFFKNDDPLMINAVSGLIECTKTMTRPYNKLQRIYWDAYYKDFTNSYEKLLKNEHLIHKDHYFLTPKQYKEKRIKYLNTCKGLFGNIADRNIDRLIKYIEKTYK